VKAKTAELADRIRKEVAKDLLLQADLVEVVFEAIDGDTLRPKVLLPMRFETMGVDLKERIEAAVERASEGLEYAYVVDVPSLSNEDYAARMKAKRERAK